MEYDNSDYIYYLLCREFISDRLGIKPTHTYVMTFMNHVLEFESHVDREEGLSEQRLMNIRAVDFLWCFVLYIYTTNDLYKNMVLK